MCACVRHSTEDAIAEGFRPIVVKECVGDRIRGAVEWNLFDIDAKFGDVESLDNVLDYLRRNGRRCRPDLEFLTGSGGLLLFAVGPGF